MLISSRCFSTRLYTQHALSALNPPRIVAATAGICSELRVSISVTSGSYSEMISRIAILEQSDHNLDRANLESPYEATF